MLEAFSPTPPPHDFTPQLFEAVPEVRVADIYLVAWEIELMLVRPNGFFVLLPGAAIKELPADVGVELHSIVHVHYARNGDRLAVYRIAHRVAVPAFRHGVQVCLIRFARQDD